MHSDRLAYINNVNKFIDESKLTLCNFLNLLNWKEPVIDISSTKSNKSVYCPYDKNHLIPEKCFDKHVEQCSLKKNGYSKEDIFLPPADGGNVVVIDKETQENVLKNVCNFSSGISAEIMRLSVRYTERCAIYDFAIKNTSNSSESNLDDANFLFNKTHDNVKPKSLEELLAAERDARRRRIKYKSKKVHTGRKTQTEVLREVIQSQMEGYEEWLQQQGSQLSRKQKDDLSINKDMFGNISNTSMNDSKIKNCKEIVREWDSWSYYYRGNPHKRYFKVIQEERDHELRKKERKLLIKDDSTRDCSRKYARDDQYTKDRVRYQKHIEDSLVREKSFEKEVYKGYHRLHYDKHHKKDTKFKYLNERNEENYERYSYDRKLNERRASYDYENSGSCHRKRHSSRERSACSYNQGNYKDKHDSLPDIYSSSSSKKVKRSDHHKQKYRKNKKHKHKKFHKKKSSKGSECDSTSSKSDVCPSDST